MKNNSHSDSERLRTVLDILGITAYKLAKELGYKTPSTVYHVTNGKNGLSHQLMEGIVKRYPTVNYLYLKNGQGNPLLTSEEEVLRQKNSLIGKVPTDNMETVPEEITDLIKVIIVNQEKLNSLLLVLIEQNRQMREGQTSLEF